MRTLIRFGLCAAAIMFVVFPAFADYNPTSMLRMPSIAAVQGAHLANYKQFYLAAYGNGSLITTDGAEGSFTKIVACVDDVGLTCIHDVDGIAFSRDNVNGDMRQAGLTLGSPYDANAFPTTVLGSGNIIQNAMTTLAALGLHNYTTGQVALKIGTSVTVPSNSTLSCDIIPSVLTAGVYRNLPGTLWLGHGATLIGSGSAAPASNCNILPEWYLNPAKATFTNGNTSILVPAQSYGDLDGYRQNMIAAGDVAVECTINNGIDGCQPHDLLIAGFDNGFYGFKASHLNTQNLTIDANVGVYATSGGGQTDFRSVDVEPMLTKQVGDIRTELWWTVDSVVPSTHNVNAQGRPVCEITLSAGVDPQSGDLEPFDTHDIKTSLLDTHGNPISYPGWMANGTNTDGKPYGCNGRWPLSVISYGGGSGSASTAVVDLIGSDFAHASGGGAVITTQGQWVANSPFLYIRGLGCGIPQTLHVGQAISSAGTGFPSGTVTVAAILHAKGQDPTDAFRCILTMSASTTAAQSTDVDITFDSGTYHTPPAHGCDGNAKETCFFLQASERAYSGNSAAGLATQRIPQSDGSQLGAAFFFDHVAGPRGINTFCYGHHYCMVALDSPSTTLVQEAGDDNGELDDPLQIYMLVAGAGNSASITTNKNSKTGTSIINDTYSVTDITATNTTSSAVDGLGTGTGSLLVGSTAGFQANGGVLAICKVVKGDGTCNVNHDFEYVNYTITDGTHFNIFARGVFGSITTAFAAGTYTLIDQSIGNTKGCVGYTGLNNPATTTYLNHYEALHGCLHLTNVRGEGVGNSFVSHNIAAFQAVGNYMPQTTNYFEDATARAASIGAANFYADGDPTTYISGPVVPKGRLTFVSGTPVLTSSVAAQATIYYTAYVGNTLSIFDGNSWDQFTINNQALDISNAGNFPGGNLFDVYAFLNSNTVTLCATQWGTTSAGSSLRGLGAAQHLKDGLLVNSVIQTCFNGATTYSLQRDTGLYLGSFYTTGAGQSGAAVGLLTSSGGSAPCMCLWNAYNRVRIVPGTADSSGASWTTTSASWQPLDAGTGGGTGNRVTWIDGLAQTSVFGTLSLSFKSSAAGTAVSVGTAMNSTSATPTISLPTANANYTPANVTFNSPPKLGLNYLQAMQQSDGATTETILGSPSEVLRLDLEY